MQTREHAYWETVCLAALSCSYNLKCMRNVSESDYADKYALRTQNGHVTAEIDRDTLDVANPVFEDDRAQTACDETSSGMQTISRLLQACAGTLLLLSCCCFCLVAMGSSRLLSGCTISPCDIASARMWVQHHLHMHPW